MHLAIIFDLIEFKATALGLAALGILLRKLIDLNFVSWLIFLLLISSVLMAWYVEYLNYIIYVTSVSVPLFLFLIFGNSLTKNSDPLVTAIGEAVRGPLSCEMRKYTKGVTWVWTLIFLVMTLMGVCFLIRGDINLWSLTTNFINPSCVVIFFISEFFYRVWKFPDHDHPSFLDYLLIVRDYRFK